MMATTVRARVRPVRPVRPICILPIRMASNERGHSPVTTESAHGQACRIDLGEVP